MKSRLMDPGFEWIPAASHDADSRPFYQRQMARIAEADKVRKEAEAKAAKNVQPITTRRKA